MEMNTICGLMGYAGRMSMHSKRIEEAKEYLYTVSSPQCGNCTMWMTRQCKKEITTKRLMSMNTSACKEFNIKEYYVEAAKKKLDNVILEAEKAENL